MKLLMLCSKAFVVMFFSINAADCFDPLDPNGNITVTFDILQQKDDTYMARVTIQNYYQYRHIESPGWKLGWIWAEKEIILSMSGAVATKQGDCTLFSNEDKLPHSCVQNPTIIDQKPSAAGENWTMNCCHDGILSALAIDSGRAFSSFNMYVGNLPGNGSVSPPVNLTLMAPGLGYTCDQLEDIPPTTFDVEGGYREEQALRTWKSACTYSAFVVNNTPSCCVSLSTFYSPKIVSCPDCSCSCQDKSCAGVKEMKLSTTPNDRNNETIEMVGCTRHMCPVQVHWHVKTNYRNKWRVKMTISNYRYNHNYSDWNVVVQHPGLSQTFLSDGFNHSRLTTIGGMDEAAIFWGKRYYNTELPEAMHDQSTFVTSDLLMDKNYDQFTLDNGWALPRRVYYNGHNCEMSDDFPGLPSASTRILNSSYSVLLFWSLISFFSLVSLIDLL